MEIIENELSSDDDVLSKKILLRQYQAKLINIAKNQNSIIFLPTGAGKTTIAIHVLCSRTKEIIQPWSQGGKRAFFVANTKVLVHQLSQVLQIQTKFKVGKYTGDLNIDTWKREKWIEEFESNHVLVLTAEILRNILQLKIIEAENISVIVLDECHHAVLQHPYRGIMQNFKDVPMSQMPLIVGLSSILLNQSPKIGAVANLVHSLESTLRAKIITETELTEIFSFMTYKEEKLVLYNSEEEIWNAIIVSNICENACAMLDEVMVQKNESKFIPSGGIAFNNLNLIPHITKYFKNAERHIKDMGVYVGSLSVLYYIILLEKTRLLTDSSMFKKLIVYARTELNKVRHVLSLSMGDKESYDLIYKFSSHKIQKLIDLIEEIGKIFKNTGCCTIIFVRERVTAIILAFMLKRLSALEKRFNFVKAEFVVGTSVFKTEFNFLGYKNEEIIKQFETGRLNVLVATNVLEEGIDVPGCNVVINFDFPSGYPSYVQSKGRARSKESIHYVFTPMKDQVECEAKLKHYGLIHQELYKIITCDADAVEEDDEEENEIFYLQTDSSLIKVDGSTAVKCVEKYCSSLSHDLFSLLRPIAWFKNTEGGKQGFLKLPAACPVFEIVQGNTKKTKRMAKKSAFLKAVKLLYEVGELKLDLNPRVLSDADYSDIFPYYKEENIDKNLPQPGTNKRKQSYKTKFANCLSECLPQPGKTTYLHVFNFKLASDKPENDRKAAVYDLLKSPSTYGILSSKKLKEICQFPLFLDVGQVNCDFLINSREFVFNQQELNDIKSFHFSLFKKVLRVVQKVHVFDNRNKEHSFFVVPLNKENGNFVINWDVIRCDFCQESVSAVVRYNPSQRGLRYPQNENAVFCSEDISKDNSTSLVPLDGFDGRVLWSKKKPEEISKQSFIMNKADYEYFIISPYYRSKDFRQYYIVTQICRDLTPLSPFPTNNYTDYFTYYQDKYGIEITNLQQPLLKVRPIYSSSNFNRPIQVSRKARDRQKEYDEYLLPELCNVIPFLNKYWIKACLLPTVLNRITHIYLVDEFRRKVAKETGLGVQDLPVNESWKPLGVIKFNFGEEKDSSDSLKFFSDVRSSLPLSQLKSKTRQQKSQQIVTDPERNLYDVGLCDLEFYAKQLFDDELIDEHAANQNNTHVSSLVELHNIEVPKLGIFQCIYSPLGPDLATFVQALTSKSANDVVDYERLEIIGDSFLKFASSVFLFKNYFESEGILTSLKGKIVGNKNLLYCALEKNVQDVINVVDFSPSSDWNPPLFCLHDDLLNCMISNNVDTAVIDRIVISQEEQFLGVLSVETLKMNDLIISAYHKSTQTVNNSLFPYRIMSDKTVSDCVESLVGAYLLSLGLPGAFKILSWFGIIPEDKGSYEKLMVEPYRHVIKKENFASIEIILDEIFYSELENILGYQFKNKAFLLEALTHSSAINNQVTKSYEVLEFLGDAVLDFLVTSYIYETCGDLSPGKITDIRSSLVNNTTFACLTVRYGFHKYLITFSKALNDAIETFVKFQQKRNHVVDENVLILIEEQNCLIAESVEVPKALGDVFESLAGAIFLDSDNSLETVWKIFYKLMKREIDEFTKTTPINASRWLSEILGEKPTYEYKLSNGKVVAACLAYYGDHEIKAHGFGQSKKEAKRSAAKLVLKKIFEMKK